MADTNKFIRTTAINKIRRMKKTVRGIQGGTSAGKTFGILPILIDYAAKRDRDNPEVISVVSESVPHLKRGAMKDFKTIMKKTGRWVNSSWKSANSTYHFDNGTYIEFFSADNDTKLRGARRDVLYLNECNNVTFEAYNELAPRTNKFIYLDWNPTNEFWFHIHLMNDDDTDFLVINYKDNEACPDKAIKFIEKAKEKADKGDPYWINWYRVYGLGEIGSLEGIVFSNWTSKGVNLIPKDSMLLGYGLDFGFTTDPSALVSVWLTPRGKRVVKEEFYASGLVNAEIARLIKYKTHPVYADSAEPKSIAELKLLGVNAKPATKGADSVRFGIDVMQQIDMYYVHSESKNLIGEFRAYRVHKGKLIGAHHAIDALRYHEVMTIGRQAGKKHFFMSS